MRQIAIISCDNGLGHLRRCYLLSLKFANAGDFVTIFAPTIKFLKFQTIFGSHENIQNFNFSTGGQRTGSFFQGSSLLDWLDKLPDLKKYNLVISDNLPEILAVRSDAVLSGHFFWHDIYRNVPSYYVDYCKNLIETCAPIVIGAEIFSSTTVKSCKNYKPTGLYIYGETNFDKEDVDSILVTGGSTSIIQNNLIKLFTEIINDNRFNKYCFYVDRQLLNKTKGKYSDLNNIFIAEYDDLMYRKINYALCRPGVGTLTDLLQNGGYPICLYETENKEMQDNVTGLRAYGLGCDLGKTVNPDILLETLESAALQKNNFINALSKKIFDGAEITYSLLK